MGVRHGVSYDLGGAVHCRPQALHSGRRARSHHLDAGVLPLRAQLDTFMLPGAARTAAGGRAAAALWLAVAEALQHGRDGRGAERDGRRRGQRGVSTTAQEERVDRARLKRHTAPEIATPRPAPPPLMTTTATAKPKAKFSSRNLSAVFKAPLGTKPLSDNAAGPLQRPSNRLVVLGRAAVAAPAPLNTPSLKRESQVHDMHVSLVPAGSNWAEKPKENEAVEPSIAPAEVAVPTAPPEKAWTPESVAEHLHTGGAPARPKATAGSCGRWGDDAVEHDIVQNDIRRQRQKERDFPDLKEAVEESKMPHTQGQAPAVDRSPSMGPQHPEQHHGRATGRWAHFNEQEEARHPMHEDRWSRDRYGRDEDDRWSRDRYGRDEDDRWSRDRYSRYDDGYGRERRPYYESSRGDSAISPVPNDSRTHFSRSDARFDMVASGDRDRVLSHSPHRMDWGSSRLGRRDGRSTSPAAQNEHGAERIHAQQPARSLNQSPALAPTTPPLTAEAAPARAMNWRNLSSPDHGPDRAWGAPRRTDNAWSKDSEPRTPVAEEVSSSTESSSNSSASSSPSPAQLVQLLKRPKMLFDPKTGGMVSAEDTAAAGKRQATGRKGNEGRDRETANASTVPKPAPSQSQNIALASNASANVSPSKKAEEVEAPAFARPDDASGMPQVTASTVIAVNNVEVVVEDKPSASTPSTSSTDKTLDSEHGGATLTTKKTMGPGNKRAEAVAGPGTPKPSRASRSKNGSKAKAGEATDRGKRGVLARNDRRSTGSSKGGQNRAKASGREVREVNGQKMKVDPKDVAVLKQVVEGSSGGVVVTTDEQEGIEVSPESDGFETVKSRRVVLSEKKQRRQRLSSAEAAAPTTRAPELAGEQKSARASPEEHAGAQSKGEEVHENFGMVAAKEVGAQQRSSKPRRQGPEAQAGVEGEAAAGSNQREVLARRRANRQRRKLLAWTAATPRLQRRLRCRP
ncbi:hypothetical protein ON010_g11666 [Phytophthora cinnamomi]|nr:hypothetical protein ON010_g11666 [Phytophthora cinnamomi]